MAEWMSERRLPPLATWHVHGPADCLTRATPTGRRMGREDGEEAGWEEKGEEGGGGEGD
uniref:Uncharacterized protein n=1 Tax=Oryza sativa subsp. japonica TaxID=39947 RepID=Q69QI9_ORYSJ|nr:hypothetical protein [Oryza sativa Japonica Group]